MATIRQRGKSWQAIVRVTQGGQSHTESRTFASERLANDWGKRLEAEIKVNGIPQRALSAMTLGDLIQKYQTAINENKIARRQMNWELDQLAGEFGAVKLSRLNAKVFTDFGRQRSRDGAAGATVLHNLATLRSVLNAAKPMFGLNVTGAHVTDALNTLTRLGAVSRSTSRTRRPTADELDALQAEFTRMAARPSTVIPMGVFIALAVELPRRREELLTMKWGDYTGQQVTLRETKNPTAPRIEVIPVPPKAAAIIDALPRLDERILPYNPESVSAAFQRACARLGIRDLHLHDLRHEGISRLFEAGLDIPDVALISGHQSWMMLKRYTHLTPKQVLDKLGHTAPHNDWPVLE